MKEQTLNPSLRVYFDGLCCLCSREISHYRRLKGSESIQFVDITGPDFDATAEGLDPHEVHRVLHAKDSFGELHIGVDAFIAIWQRLPSLKWLAAVARRRSVRRLLEVGYRGFARIRPLLPRKSCADSPYCERPLRS